VTGEKSKQRQPWARTVALSLAGFVLLGILVWLVNPARVASVLRNANPGWIGLTLVGVIVATLLGAINSYLISAVNSGVKFGAFLGAYWSAWAFGQVVPGQVGDLIGISLFLRRRGLGLPMAVGRLGVDKIISLFCTFALSGLLIVIFDEPVPRIAGVLGVLAACGLLAAYFFSLRWSELPVNGHGLRNQFMHTLHEAHVVIETRPFIIAANLALTLLKLAVIGFCYWTTFRAFQAAALTPIEATVVANSAGLVAYLPISANGVGTVEAGGIYLFGLLGVAPSVVIASYLTLRAVNLALAFGGTILVLLLSATLRR